jgi:hypothetical protein
MTKLIVALRNSANEAENAFMALFMSPPKIKGAEVFMFLSDFNDIWNFDSFP